jgi:hypothetical protein
MPSPPFVYYRKLNLKAKFESGPSHFGFKRCNQTRRGFNTGFDSVKLHRLRVNLMHRPRVNMHRPWVNLHRPRVNLHRPRVNLHRCTLAAHWSRGSLNAGSYTSSPLVEAAQVEFKSKH